MWVTLADAVTLVLILANGVIGLLSFWLGRYGTLERTTGGCGSSAAVGGEAP